MQYEELKEEERKERDRLYELSKPLVLNNQPERLNPEDTRNSVCDSPNCENK